MHIICDRCFKRVGPIEELTIGLLWGEATCAYCGAHLTGDAFRAAHRLAGDEPRLELLAKLLTIYDQHISSAQIVLQGIDEDIAYLEKKIASVAARVPTRALENANKQLELLKEAREKYIASVSLRVAPFRERIQRVTPIPAPVMNVNAELERELKDPEDKP